MVNLKELFTYMDHLLHDKLSQNGALQQFAGVEAQFA